MNKALTTVVILALAACVTTSGPNLFEGPDRPDSEVATVITEQVASPGSNKPIVQLRSFNGIRTGNETLVRILPGEYKVETTCRVGQYIARPSFKATFAAGHTYMVPCVDKGESAALKVVDLGTAYQRPLPVKQ